MSESYDGRLSERGKAGRTDEMSQVADDVIYLTPEGLEKKKKELDYLLKVRRPQSLERVRQAQEKKEYVDMEDDADLEFLEFEEAKREQAMVELQIEEIRKLLLVCELIDESVLPRGVAGLGSRVTLFDTQLKEQWTCQIVAAVEADADENKISVDSPLGEALMGKRGGDTVEVNAPDGVLRYNVVRVVNRLGAKPGKEPIPLPPKEPVKPKAKAAKPASRSAKGPEVAARKSAARPTAGGAEKPRGKKR